HAQLSEPVGAARLLRRHGVGRLELHAAAFAVADPGLARGPALQGVGRVTQRGDGADAGDDAAAARHGSFARTRSMVSPTVVTAAASSPESSTPYSSSTTWASSAMSSESMSSSSSVASGLTSSIPGPHDARVA